MHTLGVEPFQKKAKHNWLFHGCLSSRPREWKPGHGSSRNRSPGEAARPRRGEDGGGEGGKAAPLQRREGENIATQKEEGEAADPPKERRRRRDTTCSDCCCWTSPMNCGLETIGGVMTKVIEFESRAARVKLERGGKSLSVCRSASLPLALKLGDFPPGAAFRAS